MAVPDCRTASGKNEEVEHTTYKVGVSITARGDSASTYRTSRLGGVGFQTFLSTLSEAKDGGVVGRSKKVWRWHVNHLSKSRDPTYPVIGQAEFEILGKIHLFHRPQATQRSPSVAAPQASTRTIAVKYSTEIPSAEDIYAKCYG
ncbi:hypothetical protein C8J57DRAFT_1234510 [Mycena rebaudengoi]|nr:hypothetical protein C8J57DRAFT_1234510 [Mycena rebaudengoi]